MGVVYTDIHVYFSAILHGGCNSLLLKELLRASSLMQGWEVLFIMDMSLANILLSPTSFIESTGLAWTHLALFTSLLSYFIHYSSLIQKKTEFVLSNMFKRLHWFLKSHTENILHEIHLFFKTVWSKLCFSTVTVQYSGVHSLQS